MVENRARARFSSFLCFANLIKQLDKVPTAWYSVVKGGIVMAFALEAGDVYEDLIQILCLTLPLVVVLPVGIAVWVLLYRLCKKRTAWSEGKTLTVVTVAAAFVLANAAFFTYYIAFSCGLDLWRSLGESDFLKELPAHLPFVK